MVWKEFQEKLEQDLLTESDFTAEMVAFLQPLLCGEAAVSRRRKFFYLQSRHNYALIALKREVKHYAAYYAC